ncbi:MAG: agmatine deiminase family protein [Endomicrobia bacterium]|nr:agmatine deiminase family protein [Endomicrobiia bacterium]
MKEIIFTAKPNKEVDELYPEFKEFYLNFKNIAEKYHTCESVSLPDIWVRDFLPIENVKTGKLYNLFYDPTYNRGFLKNFYAKIRTAVKKEFPKAQDLPVRMDGGNLTVNSQGIAFAFEKSVTVKNTSYENLSSLLKESLGLADIVWLPRLPEAYDPFCHIDGFMQFLGDDILLLNKSYDIDEITKKHSEKCFKIINSKYPNLKIIELPVNVEPYDTLSAKGIYVNFLETSKAVFVPQYNLPQDKEVFDIIKVLTAKDVVGIDCEKISKYAGSLHCLTSTQIVKGD